MLELLIVLVLVGAALALIQLVPMDATVKKVIVVIVVTFLIIWALRLLLGGTGGSLINLR